jgi:uncharacterized protein (DUF302 family)
VFKSLTRIFLLAFTLFFVSYAVASSTAGSVKVTSVSAAFDEVKDRVIFAVESQGLVVDHVSDVGGMLKRTGEDLGDPDRLYERAQVLEFCSALFSRNMARVARELLAYCPYGIAIYNLPNNLDSTYIAYKVISPNIKDPEVRKVLEDVELLLSDIVEEASM